MQQWRMHNTRHKLKMEECAKDMGQRRNHAALQCTNKVREEECAYLKVWHAGTLCSIDGCKSQAKNGGVCIKHGSKFRKILCSRGGWTNKVVNGGVYVKHGAKVKRCRIKGCTNQVIKGGVCIGHEAKKKRCRIEGCTNNVIKGGVCIWHGAKVEHGQRCSIDRCKRGICVKTGAKDKLCNKEILTNEAYRQEKMCMRHGMKEPCAINGITTQVRNGQNG